MFPTIACFLLVHGLGGSFENPTIGSNVAGQTVADILREATSSDIAWIPAALIKESPIKDSPDKGDLSSLIAFPTEGFTVISITGNQVKEALERSVALQPSPNVGFLQLSGVEASFRKNSPAGSRIASVTVGGKPLSDEKNYVVSLPNCLYQGLLGYSGIWEKSKPVRAFEGITLASLVKGKRATESAPRWTATG